MGNTVYVIVKGKALKSTLASWSTVMIAAKGKIISEMLKEVLKIKIQRSLQRVKVISVVCPLNLSF